MAKTAASKTKADAATPDDTKPAPKAAAKPAKTEAKTEPKTKGAAPKGATVEKPAKGHKPNALQQPLQPSKELAEVVGSDKLARGEAVSKVWAYIKQHKLQNPKDGREILADDKLAKVFGKDKATMFEMNKYLAAHLK